MLRLAWRNVSRDWTRSLLAISGMALAAFILTSALALSNTYHTGALARYRFALGGDIVALPGHFFVDRTLYGGAAGGDVWTWHPWDRSWQGNLGQFVPGIGENGYLAPENEPAVFRLAELSGARETLQRAGVKSIYPYLSLPAFTVAAKSTSVTPILARQPADDHGWIVQDLDIPDDSAGTRLVDGRWFDAQDDGKPVALVSLDRPADAGPAPSVGDSVSVSVPAVSLGPDGRPVFDFGRRQTFQLEVVGAYDVTLEAALGDSPKIPWDTGAIMVPAQTFDHIYRQVSGGEAPAVAGQLGLVVKDMTQMGRTLKALGQAFPGWTFLAAPQVAGMLGRGAGGAIPADLSRAFVVVSFLLAGALVAGNMYVIIHQRSKQIGILKSIGASGAQVFGMVLVEVAGYALAGGLAGWVLVTALYALIVLTSGAGLAVVGAKAAVTLVVVLGTTIGVAALFGLAPAWFAAAQPAARVLRND